MTQNTTARNITFQRRYAIFCLKIICFIINIIYAITMTHSNGILIIYPQTVTRIPSVLSDLFIY